ncbi:MAG: hypothetical protein IT438_16310 [Phycisphaerales bacterium]|nr:hypothetical protein [Phycisphaerales bacterium]
MPSTLAAQLTHAPNPPVGIADLGFIVRAAGERTADAAGAIVRRQIAGLAGGDGAGVPVTVVSERPFARAVKRTLEIGAASDRAWTIGMDADALLTRDGVAGLVRMCAEAKPGSFTVTGLMLCKFYGGFVFRGVHCYRSSLLSRAVGMVGSRTPGGPDPELKPESAVVHAMEALGFGYEGHPVVLAAHDFEQSFRHIYLKMRLRARREVEGASSGGDVESLRRFCIERAESGDADFLVALWGVEDGRADAARGGPVRHYDWFAEYPEFDARAREHGLREKPALAPDAAEGLADRVIADHRLDLDTRTPRWVREALLRKAAA